MDKNLQQLLAQLGEVIANLEAQLGDVPAALAQVRAEGFEAGKVEGDAVGYARGFEDGKNSVVPAGDKIYSQAEMDAALAPLNEQVMALQLKVNELQAVVDGMAGQIEAAVAAAVAQVKAELAAAYEAQQVAESEGETGFKELLK